MDILIENQILGPVDIYMLFKEAGNILIERYDHYNKRTYRNRFKIISPNGIQTVSIPVKHKRTSPFFKDLQIAYDINWTGRLKNTLRTCYGSAPFFPYFADDIFDIFEKKHRFLFDLNNELRRYIFDTLDIKAKVNYTSRYMQYPTAGFKDLRDKYLPVNSHKSSLPYYYPQVFEYKYGFIPGMSILDYLFNAGNSGFLSGGA